ncbi:uncharacterized protein LOC116159147 [Photinus pyralis]|uniref:uncharacterized protein LOC116159147 n=1 Tax=Photinus pyralis TaxID=7054 RepID=UPI001266E67A|nr:uncharacterized protein LOC116159147 [Photinus pyralis]
MGSSVLNYYETNKQLDNIRRKRLIDIIIKHIYTYIITNRLRHDEYNRLTAKIIDLFPNETTGTYYVPAIRERDSSINRSIMAKGKLVDKVKNLIRVCDEAIPKRRRKNNDAAPHSTSTNSETNNNNDEPLESNGDYAWLKFNTEPWSDVLVKWENTFHLRQAVRGVSGGNVADVFMLWSILKDLRSDTLINSDFNQLYDGKGLKLFMNWDQFFAKIQEVKKTGNKDKTVAKLLELRENIKNQGNI